MLLCHFGINLLRYHAESSSMFLFVLLTTYSLLSLVIPFMHAYLCRVIAHALHFFCHLRHGKPEGLHHGNDRKRAMIPNALWVRRDGLSGSYVCG